MKINKLIIVCDACCRIPDSHVPGRIGKGNSACGVIYLKDDKVKENKLDEKGKYLGLMTVPEAEYNGLIFALDQASSICREEIEVWLDSELVVRHLTNEYRLKAENLKPLYDKVKSLELRFKVVKYHHHSRKNEMAKEADRLASDVLAQYQ